MNLIEYSKQQAADDARATGGTKRLPRDTRSIDERAAEFIARHPDVVALLRDLALALLAKGHTHYSIDGLFHVVRYQHATSAHRAARDGGFALNNDYTAPVARHIMATAPELDGFFETRARRSERAYNERCKPCHAGG